MKSKRFGDSKLRLRDILCYIIGIMIVLTYNKQEHPPRTFNNSNLPLIMSQKNHTIFLAALDHDLLYETRHLTIAFFPTLPKLTGLLIRLN